MSFQENLENVLTQIKNKVVKGQSKKFEIYIGESQTYKETCGNVGLSGATEEDVEIDKIPPVCSLSISKTSNIDSNGYYKFKTKITASDNKTPAEKLKVCTKYTTESDYTCTPTATKLNSDGVWTGSELIYNSSKKYYAFVKDEDGNIGSCTHTLAPPKPGLPRCYFKPDEKKNEYLKGGETRELIAYCFQPDSYSKHKAADYIVGANSSSHHYYSKIRKNVSKKGNWESGQTSGKWRKITLKYVAKTNSQQKIANGKERIKIKKGYIYFLNISKKEVNKNPVAYSSSYIRVDNVPPSITASPHKTRHGSGSSAWYKTSSKSPFKVTFTCTDKGSGVDYMKINGTKYNKRKVTLSRKTATTGTKYKIECYDNAGNKKTKTYKYRLKVYSQSSSCGGYCSKYNYESYCAAYKTKESCTSSTTTTTLAPYFSNGKCNSCGQGYDCTCQNRHEGGSFHSYCTNCKQDKTTRTCKTVETSTCKTWDSRQTSCNTYTYYSCWHY